MDLVLTTSIERRDPIVQAGAGERTANGPRERWVQRVAVSHPIVPHPHRSIRSFAGVGTRPSPAQIVCSSGMKIFHHADRYASIVVSWMENFGFVGQLPNEVQAASSGTGRQRLRNHRSICDWFAVVVDGELNLCAIAEEDDFERP